MGRKLTRNDLQKAVDMARQAYQGKNFGTCTLFDYSVKVADTIKGTPEKIIALLHAILLSDPTISLEKLTELFGADVSKALDALTRREEEPYLVYINRVSANGTAMKIKQVLLDKTSDCFADADTAATIEKCGCLNESQKKAYLAVAAL